MRSLDLRGKRLFQFSVGALAIIFLAPSSANADNRFSTAISGYSTVGCGFLAGPIYSPSIEWSVPGQALTSPGWTDDIRTIDSADGQNVLALLSTSSQTVQIVRLLFDNTYPNNSRSPFFQGLPGYSAYGPFAVARNGRVFVAVVSSGQYRLAVISSSGTLEALLALTIPLGSNMAVASDGCTLFYVDHSTIRRADACIGTQLPLLATTGSSLNDVASLSSGDVLAITDNALLRFNATGALVQTLTVPNLLYANNQLELQALAVSNDERVVVLAAMAGCQNGGQLISLAFPDGSQLSRQPTSYISTATGLVVSPVVPSVPALSTIALVAFGISLGAIGALRC